MFFSLLEMFDGEPGYFHPTKPAFLVGHSRSLDHERLNSGQGILRSLLGIAKLIRVCVLPVSARAFFPFGLEPSGDTIDGRSPGRTS